MFRESFGERGAGGGKFLKVKSGESVKGVFAGPIVEYTAKWNGKNMEPCHPDDEKARDRFRVNFITRENDALVAKIFEQGPVVYHQLRTLHEEYNLFETIVIIKREGSTKDDTVYTVLPAKENRIGTDMAKQIAQVKLHDLKVVEPEEIFP